ncbi:hypothetical protein ANCCEY_00374 [Ancylostoma ceylanicum]|uniref:Transmembrane protein 164 n=1 Tax=Ancylostoma ceylanicum TaxID=53326 RepID=A0A0D6MDD6_9BILA|nr:hypothetical protein ANCCEY_00374 [Ancylostoma ceylanicum]
MAGIWWDLATGGVNHSIQGNGGEECMTVSSSVSAVDSSGTSAGYTKPLHCYLQYLPTWQRLCETALFVPLAVRTVLSTIPALDCSFASRPKNDSRYAVLTLYSLIFGAELAFKMISKTGIFLLNPCHITTAMQLVLLTMDANDRKIWEFSGLIEVHCRRACFLFRLNMYFMPGAFFALAFPILNTRTLPGEVFVYYAQHLAIILVPLYLMYLRGAFEPEKAGDYTWTAFGLCVFLLYHFIVLQGMAMVRSFGTILVF